MLQWVAEFEAKEGSTKKMKCPACKGRIRVIQPHDPVVSLNDWLFRKYSRATPPLLLTLLIGMGGAGSAWYGASAAMAFTGTEGLFRFLRVDSMVRRGGRLILADRATMAGKMLLLQMIAPVLLISRALPFVKTAGAVFSLVLGASLGWRGNVPKWPPSPAWAFCLFPVLSLTYHNLYFEFFGRFERNLDRRLRGRPTEDEAAAQPPPDVQRQGQPQPAADDQQPAQGAINDEHRGLLGAVWGLAEAVLGLVAVEELDDDHDHDHEHHEHQLQLELEINIGQDQGDQGEGEGQMEEIVIVGEGDGNDTPPIAVDDQAPPPTTPEDMGEQEANIAPAVPLPVAVVAQPAEAQDAPAAQGQAADDRIEDMTTNIFTRMLNATVSQLMLPFVCAAAGEVLRVTLPTRLVTKTRWGQPGLLQQRWGRSLVGGCIYIVARDAVKLYSKYRRLEVKSRRKVKNVPRRKKTKRTQSIPVLSE